MALSLAMDVLLPGCCLREGAPLLSSGSRLRSPISASTRPQSLTHSLRARSPAGGPPRLGP
eukprot:2801494-Alexandrium_andersonii.AAC.1